MHWSSLYALLTSIVGVFTLATFRSSKESLESAIAFFVLLGAFFVSNASVAIFGTGHMRFYLPMDIMIGVFFLSRWWASKLPWLLAMALSYGVECQLHVWYMLSSQDDAARHSYELCLNFAYVFQLCCVAFPSMICILSKGKVRGHATE